MKNTRAFTLLEMVAVLVVVGLMLAFSPMVIDSMIAEKELEKEASRLGSMIEAIRIQSLVDQARYAIHYDTEEHRWAVQIPIEITQEGETTEDAEPVTQLVLEDDLGPEELDWHDLPEGFEMEFFEGKREIDKGRYRVVFDPKGSVPPHTIIIESNNVSSLEEEERIRTIKVNFPGFVSYATGRVVEEFKRSEGELR